MLISGKMATKNPKKISRTFHKDSPLPNEFRKWFFVVKLGFAESKIVFLQVKTLFTLLTHLQYSGKVIKLLLITITLGN